MFIHLGGNQMICLRDVVAIIDASTKNQVLLEMIEANHIPHKSIKSYIVTDYKVYASPISSLTLKKRAAQVQSLMQWK